MESNFISPSDQVETHSAVEPEILEESNKLVTKKPFSKKIFILLLILVLVVIAVWGKDLIHLIVQDDATKSGIVACTEEAKQCPDGSFVTRTEPDCEFKACPTQSGGEEGFNSLSEHKSSDFSFKYPNDWKISEYKINSDNNPITWDEMTFFDTPDKERIAFFQFKNVEKKSIEDLYKEYEEEKFGREPETHFLVTQKGLAAGNELLMSTMSDDVPPNGPAYSNSHDDQTFVLVTFWCGGSYYRFEYFALNQGSHISNFEKLLNSFECSSDNNGETEIPKIDKSLFIYPPAEKFIN